MGVAGDFLGHEIGLRQLRFANLHHDRRQPLGRGHAFQKRREALEGIVAKKTPDRDYRACLNQ